MVKGNHYTIQTAMWEVLLCWGTGGIQRQKTEYIPMNMKFMPGSTDVLTPASPYHTQHF